MKDPLSKEKRTKAVRVVRGWMAVKDGKPVPNENFIYKGEFSLIQKRADGWLNEGEKWARAELRVFV